MNSTSRLWRGLGIVFILSFAALGWLGREIYLAAPPIPEVVRTVDGERLYRSADSPGPAGMVGHEPKAQKLGVDALFYALVAIVVGSTVCGWLGSLAHAGFHFDFWFGAQGLEYTNMGRLWQILLFVGLLFWLFLLGRALWPALKRPSETRGLVAMVFLSAACIGAFYSTSLTWGQHTHYSMIEYWRWWLVHLWVEGFFEVFATAVVALIFTKLGLLGAASANRAIVAETIVFLFGGILGTLHHLYWTGTPTSVIAVGAVFSALEGGSPGHRAAAAVNIIDQAGKRRHSVVMRNAGGVLEGQPLHSWHRRARRVACPVTVAALYGKFGKYHKLRSSSGSWSRT